MKIHHYGEVFSGANSSTHSKICMIDVIKCDIAILSKSPVRWSHSVDINITILKIFNLLFHWILHPIFTTSLTKTGPWVLRDLCVICSNNHCYHWVFIVDFVEMYYIYIFILIYSNFSFTLVIFFFKILHIIIRWWTIL